MPRYQNPADINFYQGEPTPNGKLYFYESGTTTPKAVYKESGEENQWTQPVLLDSAGREPNIFYSGSAKVVLTTGDDIPVWERDPVGGESILGNFSEFSLEILYSQNDIVSDDGKFYISLVSNNQGNDPSVSPNQWMEIRFISVYNAVYSYTIGEVSQTTDGNLWKSLIPNNIGNDPSTDDGTNWAPAVDADLIVTPSITVIPQTGGGALTAGRINELQDSGAYTLPSAASVPVNTIITIDLPDRYNAQTPTVAADGSDTITDRNGADTDIEFAGSARLYLTSDGVSNWSL